MPRKEKKYHYLYKTTNLLNSKFYIGVHSTNDLNDGYLGSGKRLRYSINKYGESNFKKEILEFFDSRKKLLEKEENVVNLNLIKEDLCMNLQVGGGGGLVDDKHEKKLHEGATKYLKNRWKNDIEYREKISSVLKNNVINSHKNGNHKYDTFTGKKHTKETKEKISKANKGKNGKLNSQYGTIWITNDITNKKIKKDILEKYLGIGWRKGRILK
jgi:hypothetical protein